MPIKAFLFGAVGVMLGGFSAVVLISLMGIHGQLPSLLIGMVLGGGGYCCGFYRGLFH